MSGEDLYRNITKNVDLFKLDQVYDPFKGFEQEIKPLDHNDISTSLKTYSNFGYTDDILLSMQKNIYKINPYLLQKEIPAQFYKADEFMPLQSGLYLNKTDKSGWGLNI